MKPFKCDKIRQNQYFLLWIENCLNWQGYVLFVGIFLTFLLLSFTCVYIIDISSVRLCIQSHHKLFSFCRLSENHRQMHKYSDLFWTFWTMALVRLVSNSLKHSPNQRQFSCVNRLFCTGNADGFGTSSSEITSRGKKCRLSEI